jgi:hypothetical protein
VSITGKASIAGLDNIGLTVDIAPSNGNCAVDVKLLAAADAQLSIPGVPWFAASNIGLDLASKPVHGTEPPVDAISGAISGTVELAGVAVPVKLMLPGSGENWTIVGDFENMPLPSLTQLTHVLGGYDLTAILPPQFVEAPHFSLTDLDISFDPNAPSVSSVGIGIATTVPMKIIPGMLEIGSATLFFRVANPLDAANRAFSGAIAGTLRVGDADIELEIEVPDVQLRGKLAEGSILSLENIAGLTLPPDFPVIALSDLSASVDVEQRSAAIYGRSHGVLEMIPGRLAMHDIAVDLSIRPEGVRGSLGATVQIGELDVILAGECEENLVLTAGIPELNLTALVQTLLPEGVTLPDEVPDLNFQDLSLSVTPHTGEFSLSGRCVAAWALPFGVSNLAVTSTAINIQRGPQTGEGAASRPGPISCSLTLSGPGPVDIVDGLTFENVSLRFELVQGSSWSVSGSIGVRLFDGACTLAASLSQTEAARTFTLSTKRDPRTPAFQIAGIATLNYEEVTIQVSKSLAAGAADEKAVRLNDSAPYTWEVSVNGGLKIDALPGDELAGVL